MKVTLCFIEIYSRFKLFLSDNLPLSLLQTQGQVSSSNSLGVPSLYQSWRAALEKISVWFGAEMQGSIWGKVLVTFGNGLTTVRMYSDFMTSPHTYIACKLVPPSLLALVWFAQWLPPVYPNMVLFQYGAIPIFAVLGQSSCLIIYFQTNFQLVVYYHCIQLVFVSVNEVLDYL